MSDAGRPRLYSDLASWFHLLTAPHEYVDEAAYNAERICEAASGPVRTVLELGSGGGNNASHLRSQFKMTLTDLSMEMLSISRQINPEVEHIQGDMRSLRLSGRVFDAVFVHDAVSYLTIEGDVHAMAETASAHCREGGAILVVPDHVREHFAPPYVQHGGNDDPAGRGLRYVMWTTDPDPGDTTYLVDFAYLLRDPDGSVEVEYDRHVLGLFPEAVWSDALRNVGFEPTVWTDPWGTRVFSGTKREG